jgi:hypothetical protein
MYSVGSEWLKDQILTFGYSVGETSDGDPKQLTSFIRPIVDGVVEALNADDPDDIWDIIRRFERAMSGNYAVESIFDFLTTNVRKLAKRSGYDPRVKFRVREVRVGHRINFVFEMDLDATIAAVNSLNQEILEEDLDEIVSDHPGVDVLQKLENVRKRELQEKLNSFTRNVLGVRVVPAGASRRYLNKGV